MNKLSYKGREIVRNAVDYGDGSAMVQYVDTGEVAIILKKEISVDSDSDKS